MLTESIGRSTHTAHLFRVKTNKEIHNMAISNTLRGSILKQEVDCSKFIPYSCHVDNSTVKLRDGGLVQVIKIEGVAHETSDITNINSWYEGRNNLWRSIASAKHALWTTIIRHEQNEFPEGEYKNVFANDLNNKYKSKIKKEKMFVNDMYISIVTRSTNKTAMFTSSKKNNAAEGLQQREEIKLLTDTTNQILSSLATYSAKRLEIYENDNGLMYSEVYEYFGWIINGFKQSMPLVRTDAANFLATTRLFFGNEAFEIRGVNGSTVGGTLGIKEYCAQSGPGMLDGLLSLPYPFILTQSFTFINKPAAIAKMTMQRNRMVSASDLAQTQIDEIDQALDDLVSNRFVMGDHHLTMSVHAKSVKQVQDRLAMANTTFGEMGFVMAQEDLALECAYWAQLPGNHSDRPRVSPLTSYNFAGLSSFHNYPYGNISGNHWGSAVTLLKTTSATPFYFSFHKGDLGNTTIIGPSGTGKTVAMGFLIAQCEKFKPKGIFFDKDRGAEILIRAQGGHYTAIKKGIPAGFNPLQREMTPANKAFMGRWLRLLATSMDKSFTVHHAEEINAALNGLEGMDMKDRQLKHFVSFFDPTIKDGVYIRLTPWFGNGEFAWAFDNAEDKLNLDPRLIGFDITEILDDEYVRTPMLYYLFSCVESLINGQRLMIFIDEGWKAVDDPVFIPMIKDWEKTIRKRNGFIVFGTQSPSDISTSAIGPTIIEQSATNIFMPNLNASRQDYVDAFKLSETEYQIIKNLDEKSRCMLIRQGQRSVVAELNLSGMDDEIAVLSGTEANVNLLDSIRNKENDAVSDWLPKFYEQRKSA